jgi:hypothetical protein
MSERRSFTTAQLAQIIDRPVRLCIDWAERGLFVADQNEASGPGSRRKFSYGAVLRAALGLFLQNQYSFSRAKIKEILELLSEWNFFRYWDGSLETKNQVIPSEGGWKTVSTVESDTLWLFIVNTLGQTEVFWSAGTLIEALSKPIALISGRNINASDIVGFDLSPIKKSIDSKIAQLP